MSSQNMFYEEQWMMSQLNALRHLPPGCSLPVSGSHRAASLVSRLLTISVVENPFLWLQREEADSCAFVTLALSLNLGERMRLSHQKLTNTHLQWGAAQATAVHDLEEKQTFLYGRLLARTEAWPRFDPWDDAFIEIHEKTQLQHVLQDMQHQARLSSDPHPFVSQENRREEYVLSDLLRLPPTIDALSWLIEERRGIIAYLTAARLLDLVLPSKRMIAASSPLLLQSTLNLTLLVGNSLHVDLQRIVNRQTGFTLDLSAYYPIPREQQALVANHRDEDPHTMINWKGFERIEDTKGYSYLIQTVTHRAQTLRNKRRQENLTLACWPPLPLEETTELILHTQPVLFALYQAPVFTIEGRTMRVDTIVPRPAIVVADELSAHVVLHPH